VAILAGEAAIFGLRANDPGAFDKSVIGIRRSIQAHDRSWRRFDEDRVKPFGSKRIVNVRIRSHDGATAAQAPAASGPTLGTLVAHSLTRQSLRRGSEACVAGRGLEPRKLRR
jgi:hypothetical protein